MARGLLPPPRDLCDAGMRVGGDGEQDVPVVGEERPGRTRVAARAVAVDRAAASSGQISENITGVSTAADSTSQALGQARTAVDEPARMAAELRASVSRFTY